MSSNIQNKKLYLIKKKCLKDYIDNIADYDWPIVSSCCYLGKSLRLHCESLEFDTHLKSILPKSWFENFSDHKCTDIYIHSYKKFNIEDLQWDDESSQDCFIENHQAIQRDFAAATHDNKIYLIMDEIVGDGFYNFLRWYLPREILKSKKIVLHSSCVIFQKDGKANFFLGHSGAGKSTIADLASERIVLGDDMNLLSFENGKVFAQAGAIGGQFYPNVDYSKKYEINSFYYLIQGNVNRSTQMDTSKAFLKIISSFANLFWEELEEPEKQHCFQLAKLIVTNFNFYHLTFKKDKTIYEVIDGPTSNRL